METYVLDAHVLAWFLTEDPRLSGKATQILEQAQEARVQALIPTIVLAEIAYIAQKKRVPISIQDVIKRIDQGDGFIVVSFDYPVFQLTLQLHEEWEIHDRIIAATALYYKAILVTNDQMLTVSNKLATIW